MLKPTLQHTLIICLEHSPMMPLNVFPTRSAKRLSSFVRTQRREHTLQRFAHGRFPVSECSRLLLHPRQRNHRSACASYRSRYQLDFRKRIEGRNALEVAYVRQRGEDPRIQQFVAIAPVYGFISPRGGFGLGDARRERIDHTREPERAKPGRQWRIHQTKCSSV